MRQVHLLGIGGAGMSGIARVLAARGIEVSGCDRSTGGHDPAHLHAGMEVGYSTAIDPDERELVHARFLGLPVRHRSELLAEIVASGAGLCVAGTHGKTTTSALIAFVLRELGHDPTFIVGGEVPQLGAGSGAGEGPIVVAEADESDGSLAVLRPHCAIVLNAELDHHDHFGGLDELLALLAGWAARLPQDGLLVAGDGLDLASPAPVVRAGLGPGTGWRALEPEPDGAGVRFSLARPGRPPLPLRLGIPGAHNAGNAAAALAALEWADVDADAAAEALAAFRGAARRFEEHGAVAGIRLVDDYAHHPTEVAATLAAARGLTRGRLLACFQPHMHWRTRLLQREFAEALSAADAACVCDVYLARGAPEPGVTGELIVQRLRACAPELETGWTPTYDDAATWLAARARPGDMIVTMGAGPVDRVIGLVRERLA